MTEISNEVLTLIDKYHQADKEVSQARELVRATKDEVLKEHVFNIEPKWQKNGRQKQIKSCEHDYLMSYEDLKIFRSFLIAKYRNKGVKIEDWECPMQIANERRDEIVEELINAAAHLTGIHLANYSLDYIEKQVLLDRILKMAS